MLLDWTCGHHVDLTPKELYALLQLCIEVFVVEQKYPYQEVDGLDPVGDTHHLMAWRGGQSFAYLRLLDPARHEGQVAIGWVASSSAARGQGLSHQLVERTLQTVERSWLDTPIYLSAQAHLRGYYSHYNFVAVTEVYLGGDVPHIGMRRA